MGTSIEDALGQLFGDGQPIGPGEEPVGPTDMAGLASEAARLWREAQRLVQSGDWAGYGRTIEELGRVLTELEGLSGGGPVTPSGGTILPESPIQ